MHRLSGLDASFLYMETPAVHMHVVGVSVLEPPEDLDAAGCFDRLRDMFASRLHRIPSFRRRIRMTPFGLDHPVWEDDPSFDTRNHFHRAAVPSPGTRRELGELVGEIASRPLDRNLPLWEVWVVEGLEGGRLAMVTKLHHAIMDGVSGASVLPHLLDVRADATDPIPEPWTPERPVSPAELLLRSIWASTSRLRLRDAPAFAGEIAGTIWSAVTRAGAGGDPREPGPALPFETPTLRFNRSISSRRTAAFARAELDDFKVVKNAFGTTVNDVVLAACSISLREYLLRRGDLPDAPLLAAVPVAVRGEDARDEIDNRVSAMFVRLPVQLADPVEQLRFLRDETKRAKEFHRAIGAGTLRDLTQYVPGPIFRGAMQLYSSLHLADRHRPPVNVIISNVPGPPIPLYAAGARLESLYPMGPILEGVGLNLTVLSNMGHVDMGAIACRETVPDLWRITDGFADAVGELVDAVRRHARGVDSTRLAARSASGG